MVTLSMTKPLHCSHSKPCHTRGPEPIFVADVRTASFEGKLKRMGRHVGRRADWKKAIVTLAEGHKIDLVEGA